MEGFHYFYVLLDRGPLALCLAKMCGLITLAHLLLKLAPSRTPVRISTALLLLLVLGWVGSISFADDRQRFAVAWARDHSGPEAGRGGLDIAAKAYDSIVISGSTDPATLSEYALVLIRLGNASDAVSILDRVPLARRQRHPEYFQARARALLAAGHPRDAIAVVLGGLDPKTDPWALRTAVEGYLAIGKRDEAVALLEAFRTQIIGPDAVRIFQRQIDDVRRTGRWNPGG